MKLAFVHHHDYPHDYLLPAPPVLWLCLAVCFLPGMCSTCVSGFPVLCKSAELFGAMCVWFMLGLLFRTMQPFPAVGVYSAYYPGLCVACPHCKLYDGFANWQTPGVFCGFVWAPLVSCVCVQP